LTVAAPINPISLLIGVNLAGAEFGPPYDNNGQRTSNPDPGVFGTNYTYPTHVEIDYYAAKGMSVLRLPFLWERIQPTQSGALDAAELGRLDDVVSYATEKGLKIEIELHDYGFGFGSLIGSAPTPNSSFADVWGKLAGHFKSNPDVIFGLMNEPHVQSATVWLDSANAAIAAIRSAGAMQEILVPGSYWDGGWSWTTTDNAAVMGTGVKDPAHNFAFEVHQYLDSDSSGTHPGVVSPTIGVERLTAITQWAEANHQRLFLGEIGVDTDPTSLQALDNTLVYIKQHTDVWSGVTYWAGGPWWGDYMFSIEPQNGVDKPQMGILLQHLSAPGPVTGAVALVGSGDFNGNGKGEFAWRGSNGSMSEWEYDPAAQTLTETNLGPVDSGWMSFGSGHFLNGSNAGASQMLMDYVPNGTMTLWWVSNALLTGINLGANWPNIGFLSAGPFTANGGAVNDFLVYNLVDGHIYDWWISAQNQLTGIDLTASSGVSWSNVSGVATGLFTANGGANLLVSNNLDHHLYDWWINSDNTISGIDLTATSGIPWSNVSAVTTGQFIANTNTNLLVTNTLDNHLYDWWIGDNGALQGIDLGGYWANVQIVTVGRFDNNSLNTEMLVQNTVDHHLYEWWITPQGALTGIDLTASSGIPWSNLQLIGNSHFNNASADDQLLVRNTSDGHFYQWWINGATLAGIDLGAVPPGGNAGSSGAGAALMVQSMASFGADGAVSSSSPLAAVDLTQQTALAVPINPQLPHV
jgi:endoglucanase